MLDDKLEKLKIHHDENICNTHNKGIFHKYFFILIGLLIFIILAGAITFLVINEKQKNKIQEDTEITSLANIKEEVKSNDSLILLSAGGYIESTKQITIGSKMLGRIIYLNLIEGNQVEAGDIIAKLDKVQLETKKKQAEADLQVAKIEFKEKQIQLRNTEINLQRTKKLFDKGVISLKEYEDALLENDLANVIYKAAQAIILQKKAKLESINVDLLDTIIKSPISGIVIKKFVNNGEILNPLDPQKGALIAIIADLTKCRAWADINESDIAKIEIGQKAEIIPDAYPNKKYLGVVSQIMPQASREKNTVEIKINIINSDIFLKPNFSVKINILKNNS